MHFAMFSPATAQPRPSSSRLTDRRQQNHGHPGLGGPGRTERRRKGKKGRREIREGGERRVTKWGVAGGFGGRGVKAGT